MAHAVRLDDRIVDILLYPSGRPLLLQGCSRTGKTTLLRRLLARSGRAAVWLSAFELVHDLAAAIRAKRDTLYCTDLVEDERPLLIEHVEDLRGKPRTRTEVERLLRLASARRPVILTLTRAPGDGEVVRWLRPWVQLVRFTGVGQLSRS